MFVRDGANDTALPPFQCLNADRAFIPLHPKSKETRPLRVKKAEFSVPMGVKLAAARSASEQNTQFCSHRVQYVRDYPGMQGEPGRRSVILLNRPPLGIFAVAAYLALWGFSLAVLSIFLLVDLVAYPRELSPHGLAVAFAGVPVFHTLAIFMLSAGYGVASSRPWARVIGQVAILAAMVVTVCIVIAGARSVAEVISISLSTALLGTASWYLERPSIRCFMATAISELPEGPIYPR
jgi:hypothetical protein